MGQTVVTHLDSLAGGFIYANATVIDTSKGISMPLDVKVSVILGRDYQERIHGTTFEVHVYSIGINYIEFFSTIIPVNMTLYDSWDGNTPVSSFLIVQQVLAANRIYITYYE